MPAKPPMPKLVWTHRCSNIAGKRFASDRRISEKNWQDDILGKRYKVLTQTKNQGCSWQNIWGKMILLPFHIDHSKIRPKLVSLPNHNEFCYILEARGCFFSLIFSWLHPCKNSCFRPSLANIMSI